MSPADPAEGKNMFTLTRLFGALVSGGRRRSRTQSGRSGSVRIPAAARIEPLEARLAMTLDLGFQTPSGAGEEWVTVMVNQGSDAFLQMVASPTEDLLIADNSSFVSPYTISQVDATIDNVYVYNGQLLERRSFTGAVNQPAGPAADGFGLPIGYPLLGNPIDKLYFTFPSAVDASGSVTSGVFLQDVQGARNPNFIVDGVPDGDGRIDVWDVTSTGEKGVRLTEYSATLIDQGFGLLPYLEFSRSDEQPMTEFNYIGKTGVPRLTVNYDAAIGGEVVTRASVVVGGTVELDGLQQFDIFDEALHQYVPGTLTGEIRVDFAGFGVLDNIDRTLAFPLVFQVDESGLGRIPLSFGTAQFNEYGGPRASIARVPFNTYSPAGLEVTEFLEIAGTFDTATGTIELQTQVEGRPVQSVAVWLDRVEIGLRRTRVADSTGNAGPVWDNVEDVELDNMLTLFDGHNFTRGLIAELPNRGSAISLESPLLAADADNGVVSLAASSVKISAPVRADESFVIRSGEDTIFDVYTEAVTIESLVGSPSVDVRLDLRDEGEIVLNEQGQRIGGSFPYGNSLTRTQLLVTQTGSISDYANVLTPVQDVTGTPAGQVYIEANAGDVIVEGTIAAKNHTYFMRSGVNSEIEGPFLLTTRSRITDYHTGNLSGGTLAVTLANNTLNNTFETLGVLESVFDVMTSVDRLRVQASDALNTGFPYPYEVTVNETDDLIVDAVVASGGDVEIRAGGKLDLLGSVTSFSDVSLSSGDAFTLSAPVSTAFGSIQITGPSVDLRNAVRVLDAIVSDERKVDIAIQATVGDLVINDAVTAVNGVSLSAEGPAANPDDADTRPSVTGATRVSADILRVRATGDVDIGTDVNVIDVTAGGSVSLEERGSVAVTIRDAEAVRLTANGRDKFVDTEISPALYADLYGVDKLFVSAPNGSVDVRHNASGPLEIGDGEIIRRNGERMVAAGTVVINSSLASEVRVYDAPLATSGASEVRFATGMPLPAQETTFTPAAIPGVFRTDLTTKLEIDTADKSVSVLGYIRATDIRVGDRILVKDGLQGYGDGLTGRIDDDIVNGIYVVRGISFDSEFEQGLLSRQFVNLTMARATAFDTTDELGGQERHYVRVTDGNDGLQPVPSLAGRVFASDGFETQAFDLGSAVPFTPFKVAAVLPRAGFREAVAINTLPLRDVVFGQPEEGEIRSDGNRSIANDSDQAVFGGVSLRLGDIVVIREPLPSGSGIAENGLLNGLYEVLDAGSSGRPWILRRYQGVDENADGLPDGGQLGVVSITNGLQRTAVTGMMYEVSHDAVNRAPLRFQEIELDERFNVDRLDTARRGILDGFFRTEIGTGRPTGGVVYEVSSEEGTNSGAGALGKILELVHQNVGEKYSDRIVINPAVQRIDLVQELPRIELPLTLESDSELVVDGDEIGVNRTGGVVRSSRIGARVGPIKPSNAAVSRRLVRDDLLVELDRVNGFEVWPGGSGSVFRGISIGGFERGAAVKLYGAGNVLLEDVTIGGDGQGNRLPNMVGVSVTQTAGGAGGKYSTLLNSKVFNSNVQEFIDQQFISQEGGEGVSLEINTDGLRIVGSEIGSVGELNIAGVKMDSGDAGKHYIGVRRVLPAESLARLTLTPTGVDRGTVAKSDYTFGLEPGVQLFDRSKDQLWTIASRSVVPYNENMYELRLEGGDPLGDRMVGVPFGVEAGYFVDFIARTQEIVLPKGFDRGRLYLGQPIEATLGNVIPEGTTVTWVEEVRGENGIDTGETRIGISQPVGVTVTAGVLFPNSASRNNINSNVDGVVLKSGSVQINSTDITDSIVSGIRIEGVAQGGGHVIGGVNGIPRSENGVGLSEENVSISGSGVSGIDLTEKFFAVLGSVSTLPGKLALAEKVVIRGNVFGADITTNEARLANGTQSTPNHGNVVVSGDEDVGHELVRDASRDPVSGRYRAKYRPEDNPLQDPRLRVFEAFDRESNYHFVGRPVGPVEDGSEWWNNLPILS